ncbi:helix-turn-helix domain-containing protein [Alicyclobacillus dauci]|uniref:Helix-turn-helix transcriptional regulator n=1 Tax=Alicyclobacillus dauci TaxID=1475485 RepID=A0ABY6YZ75_9BACL|nr:helix-turn-helix transcriptional regulator [Alicyclobacillus dauci]WAH35000.1 helix-turn-helix transcriptional regulator [Alicyclobacillus dauci]
MDLPKRLKELRTKRDWSISEVADKLMIAKSTYAGYEYGRRDVPNELLPKIAELYHVPTDYLLGLTNNPMMYDEGWKSIDEIAGEHNADIAEQIKKLGVDVIQLNADLLNRGMTRNELIQLLQMMVNLKSNKNEPPTPE